MCGAGGTVTGKSLEKGRTTMTSTATTITTTTMRPSTTRRSALLALLTALLTVVALAGVTTLPADAAAHSAATTVAGPVTSPATTSANHNLHFQNFYRDTVYVTLMYRDFSRSCDAYGGWATKGWWSLNRGEDAYVWDTTNRYIYWYAETADRKVHWSDASPRTDVSNKAFESCYLIDNPDWRNVGLRKIDLGTGSGVYTQGIWP
jgi:uncharacterized membrane protein